MERREAFTFRTPTSIMIAGPSGCGKTVFTTRLLLENSDLFSTTPNTIHFCYGSWQHSFEIFKKCGVQFHEGVLDRNLLRKWFPEGGILILDDLMNEGSSDKNVLDLFTKDSIINKSLSYISVRICSRQVNLPKPFRVMLITLWRLKIRETS